MNFLLPANNTHIPIVPNYETIKLQNNNNSSNINNSNSISNNNIYILDSLYIYYYNIKSHIIKLCNEIKLQKDNNISGFENIIKIVNPYEYMYTVVPNTKHMVSKLQITDKLYYNFLEITNSINLFENYNCCPLNSLYIANSEIDIGNINRLIKNINNIYYFKNIDDVKLTNDTFDFIFLDINNENDNINLYVVNLIKTLIIIHSYQSTHGISIIKINHMFHKQIVDILFLLSTYFENVFIIKPDTCNIITFEKYIVCKSFIYNDSNITEKIKLINILHNYENDKTKNIISLIENEIPCYFINKLNEINIIIGHQQLEACNQIINILKNKNKEDKIENITKINIQKCINMCEKFKIPYNNLFEKNNIFLPPSANTHCSNLINMCL